MGAKSRAGNGNSRPFPVRSILSKEEQALVAPAAEDAAKYKDFLRGKNTGLFRLFPDFGCEAKNLVRVNGDCANLVPGTWNYSFRRKNYSDSNFLDVKLKDDNLTSEGFLSQGILVRLGDVPLETVSTTSKGVKFLVDYAPPTEFSAAKKQFALMAAGINDGGYKYATSARSQSEETYALRVIAYRVQNNIISRFPPQQASAAALKLANLNYADKREDLLVAFRIIRRSDNGGITILWKRLDRREAPKIVFLKGESEPDLKTKK